LEEVAPFSSVFTLDKKPLSITTVFFRSLPVASP